MVVLIHNYRWWVGVVVEPLTVAHNVVLWDLVRHDGVDVSWHFKVSAAK